VRKRPRELGSTSAVHLNDFLQAFSHWTFVRSSRDMMICDLQGVLKDAGRHPKFELTDACICTRKKQRTRRTDLGMNGIQSFFRTHQCNQVCHALDLQPEMSSIPE
jgi:hypothetical protein